MDKCRSQKVMIMPVGCTHKRKDNFKNEFHWQKSWLWRNSTCVGVVQPRRLQKRMDFPFAHSQQAFLTSMQGGNWCGWEGTRTHRRTSLAGGFFSDEPSTDRDRHNWNHYITPGACVSPQVVSSFPVASVRERWLFGYIVGFIARRRRQRISMQFQAFSSTSCREESWGW